MDALDEELKSTNKIGKQGKDLVHAGPADGAIAIGGAIDRALGRNDGPVYTLGLGGKPRTEPSQLKACAAQITQRKTSRPPVQAATPNVRGRTVKCC